MSIKWPHAPAILTNMWAFMHYRKPIFRGVDQFAKLTQ